MLSLSLKYLSNKNSIKLQRLIRIILTLNLFSFSILFIIYIKVSVFFLIFNVEKIFYIYEDKEV